MDALTPVYGKNISITLRNPIIVKNVAIKALTGRCVGTLQPGMLIIEAIASATDVSGNDATNTAGLANGVMGIRIGNISLMVYDGT